MRNRKDKRDWNTEGFTLHSKLWRAKSKPQHLEPPLQAVVLFWDWTSSRLSSSRIVNSKTKFLRLKLQPETLNLKSRSWRLCSDSVSRQPEPAADRFEIWEVRAIMWVTTTHSQKDPSYVFKAVYTETTTRNPTKVQWVFWTTTYKKACKQRRY